MTFESVRSRGLFLLSGLALVLLVSSGCRKEGIIAAQRLMAPSGDSIDFGNVLLAQADERTITLANNGDLLVSLGDITGDTMGGAFAIEYDETEIQPRRSTTLRVRFAPIREGEYSTSFVVNNDSTNLPEYLLTVTGFGIDPGPCHGVDCSTPPSPLCLNSTTARVYLPGGRCVDGTCEFETSDETCTFGCTAGACAPDPCLGKSCQQPPNPYCYQANGTCSGGTCSYTAMADTTPCSDPAAPPAPACVDMNTRRTYLIEGECQNGVCQKLFNDETCPFGCLNGACAPDPCIGISCDSPPNDQCYEPTGTCTGGVCDYTLLAEGEPCDSGDPCVPSAACTANGQCEGARTTCTPPGQTCTNQGDGTGIIERYDQAIGTCNSATGTCVFQRLPDITCDYGCAGDTCSGDPCVGNPCDDGTPCTIDTCVPGGGTYTCSYALSTLPDGITGIACTIGTGQCNQGRCQVNGTGSGTYAHCLYEDGAACTDDWNPDDTPALCTLPDVPGSCVAGTCIKNQATMDQITNSQCAGCFICLECPANGVSGLPWFCL
ncbi:MAG: choice-of-anchor D domain-containing protein [Deltaproteobacteria bacterium]|nr:choice-of-anchor D domain-containing protein [Deltaproteobacteria bacterium]